MGRGDGRGADDKIHLQHVLIKWTGSKRRQARRIVEHFPRKIATYHEPFLGGGSVLHELLDSDIEVDRVECSDACVPLIELWQVVRDDPEGLVRKYAKNWATLQTQGKGYYYEVRHEFNTANDPYLFFFLLRTCRNGLIRFNRDGEFNSGFHGARPGMEPQTVEALVGDWGQRLASKDVRFVVRDYRQVATTDGDLIYLDPPYKTGNGQYYSGMIDFGEFFGWLRGQRGDYLFSLNGFLGDVDRTLDVPTDLFDEYLLLDNGVGPYERLNGDASPPVSDSLYIRRRSPVQVSEESTLSASDPIPAPPENNSVNRSAEIRELVEADPKLTGREIVRRLADRGIKVDANLVRVVRHNLRKAKIETKIEEDRRICVCQTAMARSAQLSLKLRIQSYRIAGVPHIDEVQISLDDLLALATIIGERATSEQLTHVGHGLWMVRYSQLTGLTPTEAEVAFERHFAGPCSQLHERPNPSAESRSPISRAGQPDDGQTSLALSASYGEERDERPVHPVLSDWGSIFDEEKEEEGEDYLEAEKIERLRKMHERWRR